tara:strand:- start:199 stop:408 length:210 start_codon:yes stop_codon:yes gene_type:complete
MAQQTIKFSIRQDGTIIEEVIGAEGSACESITKRIEEKLGVVDSRQYKSEYYSQRVKENVSLHMHQDQD